MKVKFVINGKELDDIEMPSPPEIGSYVTCGQVTGEVKEIEYKLESKGYLVRVIVRCSGDFAKSRWQEGLGPA